MKFLVPVDFSPLSENALRYALSIAEQAGSLVTVLHCYHVDFGLPVPSMATVQMLEARKQASLSGLERLTRGISIRDVKIETRSEMGISWELICRIAGEGGYDGVIMGTKGEHNAAEVFFGSVTTHVMQSSPCPVWVVPEGVKPRLLRHIAYAVELNQASLHNFFAPLSLARRFGAAVHCVHVNTTQDPNYWDKEAFRNFTKLKEMDVLIDFTQIDHPSMQGGLEGFVEGWGIDLLVLARMPRGFFERIFGRSHTRYLALHGKVPLYIFQAQDPT